MLLEVSGVSSMRGGRLILSGIGLSLPEGHCLALLGVSGSGKTSLLRVIAALDPVASGRVVLNGVVRNEPERMNCGRGEVGMLFQGEQLYRHLTLLDNVTLAPRKVHGAGRIRAEKEAMELLSRVGMESLADRYPWQLSGGERQRGAIVRALALKPQLMLFDEPTSALDPASARSVLDLVLSIRRGGQSMIIVTHDQAFARAVADEIIVLENGTIRSREKPEDVSPGLADEISGRTWGNFLSEVSSADRLRWGGALVIGVTDMEDMERAGKHPLMQRLAEACPDMRFSLIKAGDAALHLRLHLADCVLSRHDIAGCHALCRAGEAGMGLKCYVSSVDLLWQKTLRAFSASDGTVREDS